MSLGALPRRRGRAGRRIVGIVVLAILALLVLGWLALWRPDIPFATLEQSYATAHSHFVELPGGVRVHVRDEGRRDGPPIVLVHGYSASLIDWDAWTERLGDEYRIVRFDLPGHGLTRTPPGYVVGRGDYPAFVDAVTAKLGLGRFVLAGNSMGGGVAWDYALRHQDKVMALVLVDAAGWPERTRNPTTPLIFKVLQNPVGRVVVKDLDVRGLTEKGLKDAFLDPALVTPALVNRYLDFARAPGHRDILLGRQGGRSDADPAKLATLRMPTLVMHGREDRLIPFSAGEGFANAIPGAELIAYDGVGHVPMEQIPDRSAADLRAFLHRHGIVGSSARVAPGRPAG